MTSPRKILSRDSNYIVDVLMCTKYCRCAHVYKVWFIWEKLLQPQFYKDLTRKTASFEEWSWFKFNNLGLALGTNLNFYTSVAKDLQLKVRKFCVLIPTFVEVTGEKLAFCPPLILNRVNLVLTQQAFTCLTCLIESLENTIHEQGIPIRNLY